MILETLRLADDSNSKQVSTILYCLGDEAEGVLQSTHLTTEDYAVYNTVYKYLTVSSRSVEMYFKAQGLIDETSKQESQQSSIKKLGSTYYLRIGQVLKWPPLHKV